MNLFNAEQFQKLAALKAPYCISIFLPTHTHGEEVLQKEDRKTLKSQWDQLTKTSEVQNISQEDLQQMEESLHQLLDDPQFWRHQKKGLAIFMAPDYFSYYQVPLPLKTQSFVLNEFYLLPLLPLVAAAKDYFILRLTLKDVRLFKAQEEQLVPVEIEDLTPSRLEERVGFDYKEKTLQARNLSSGDNQTQFHGHGAGERNDDKEIKQFFRAIDQGLQKLLNAEKLPLVVACQDHLFSLYQEANTYQGLWEEHAGTPPLEEEKLHQQAEEVIRPYLEKEKHAALERYFSLPPEQKASYLHDILPAARQGKIEVLLVSEEIKEQWGTFEENTQKVEIYPERITEAMPLLNFTAKEVLAQGGRVERVSAATLSDTEASVLAVMRYA